MRETRWRIHTKIQRNRYLYDFIATFYCNSIRLHFSRNLNTMEVRETALLHRQGFLLLFCLKKLINLLLLKGNQFLGVEVMWHNLNKEVASDWSSCLWSAVHNYRWRQTQTCPAMPRWHGFVHMSKKVKSKGNIESLINCKLSWLHYYDFCVLPQLTNKHKGKLSSKIAVKKYTQ